MDTIETIDHITALIRTIGMEADDVPWSDCGLAASIKQAEDLDGTAIGVDNAVISAEIADVAALATGAVEHEFSTRIDGVLQQIDGLSLTLKILSQAADHSQTAGASLLQTVTESCHSIATEVDVAATRLSAAIEGHFDVFARVQLETMKAEVESLIEDIRNRHSASLVAEIDQTLNSFSQEASTIVATVTNVRTELVGRLNQLEETAMQHLNARLSNLANDTQLAMQHRALNLIQSELAQAGESIIVGQTLQAGLSTGPWLPAISAAKVSMQLLNS